MAFSLLFSLCLPHPHPLSEYPLLSPFLSLSPEGTQVVEGKEITIGVLFQSLILDQKNGKFWCVNAGQNEGASGRAISAAIFMLICQQGFPGGKSHVS